MPCGRSGNTVRDALCAVATPGNTGGVHTGREAWRATLALALCA